jgi:hypothetical protein
MTERSLPGLITWDDLSELSTRETITQIKAAAIRQFEALDERIRVHSTDYFNHSFAPDLVLRWDRDSESERYVYMRSSAQAEVLGDDVARLGDLRPIMLDLVPLLSQGREKAEDSLLGLAYEKNTLITDPRALATIGEAKRDRPVTSLFSAALARGGRGLLDDADARQATDVIANGFDAARRMETDPVHSAAAIAVDHLSAPFANRFNRLLQAVWIASGGSAALFPNNQLELSAGVDDDALEYVLELEPIRDPDFWRGIGRTLSVTRIGKLTPQHPNENLQLLIKTNLDHLTIRWCRLQERQELLDEQDHANFLWVTERDALALRGRGWIAFVAEKSSDLSEIEGTSTQGISIGNLLERADDTVLTSVQMSGYDYALDLRSSAPSGLIPGGLLYSLAETFGKDARVLRARAISRGRQVACDFSKSSASTGTSRMASLTDLLGVSLPLLRDMDEDTRARLQDLLQPMDDPQKRLLISRDFKIEPPEIREIEGPAKPTEDPE